MAHRGFRREFELLARVARDAGPGEQEALIEDQIDMCLEVLHHHHTAVERDTWPAIRQRTDDAHDVLFSLEAEQAQIAPLIERIRDRTVPLADRSEDLQTLHELVNAHLDREERYGVPLIQQHISRAEWDWMGEKALGAIPKQRLPLVFGWLASHSSAEQLKGALRELPMPVRLLFRLFWCRAYKRRATKLYGAPAAAPA